MEPCPGSSGYWILPQPLAVLRQNLLCWNSTGMVGVLVSVPLNHGQIRGEKLILIDNYNFPVEKFCT